MMGLKNNFVLTSKSINNFEIAVLLSYLVWVGQHKNQLLSNIVNNNKKKYIYIFKFELFIYLIIFNLNEMNSYVFKLISI